MTEPLLSHRRAAAAESDDADLRLSGQMVGASASHARMIEQLRRIATSEAPALIEGETGSGKELAARSIHYGGARCAGPFVPVNCGALPDTLVEAELFGHERGAFTDARNARRGLVAEAAGGTLFLDEVDALSPKAQVTLLRFLQDQRYRPVGTPRELRSDVRLLAAANRPLQELVDAREFRADLMYRLNVLYLVVPPLREREGDAELLALRFAEVFAAKYHRAPKLLHPQTLAWLGRQPWPGNVRELEGWVHRQFLMSSGPCIVHDDSLLDQERPRVSHFASVAGHESGVTLASGEIGVVPGIEAPLTSFQEAKAEALRSFECEYLARAMQMTKGNVTRAAALAGKERRAFGKLLKKHGLASTRELT